VPDAKHNQAVSVEPEEYSRRTVDSTTVISPASTTPPTCITTPFADLATVSLRHAPNVKPKQIRRAAGDLID
jgi:hypothetical protein